MTQLQARVELRAWSEGCYANARIEGAPDRLRRTLGGVYATRDEAIAEATSWALGWMCRLREMRRADAPEHTS
jgi:hypothetical protein